jgi:hypothetical protein
MGLHWSVRPRELFLKHMQCAYLPRAGWSARIPVSVTVHTRCVRPPPCPVTTASKTGAWMTMSASACWPGGTFPAIPSLGSGSMQVAALARFNTRHRVCK